MLAPTLFSVAPLSVELFRAELQKTPLARYRERLDECRHLVDAETSFSSLFSLHRFPAQAVWEPADAGLATIASLPWEELDLEWLGQADFGIQLTANHRMEWSFAQLSQTLATVIASDRLAPRHPRRVLSAHFCMQGKRLRVFAGISSVDQNLSAWAAGQCRIPRDPQSVSRAEAKLLEAWEAFHLDDGPPPGPALDLGAAPGGWSRVLAGMGYRVDAVDPAPLDARVLALPEVFHHQCTAGQFLAERREGGYGLLVSDMKMQAGLAAALLARCRPLLSPNGRVLTTLKLCKGSGALAEARQALRQLSRGYAISQARQLHFNRSEITVLARPNLS